MQNKEFHQKTNELFEKIVNKIDNSIDNDKFDYELHSQFLTISYKNKHTIFINKQESIKEIWIAAVDKGYHFKFKNNNWICKRSNCEFWNVLNNIFYKYTSNNSCV